MTEQQRREIAELKTWVEWEAYVKNNGIDGKAKILDPDLGTAIHNKNMELLSKELRVAPIPPEIKEWLDNERTKKRDPNQKGFRQIIVEHNNGN